MEIVSDNGWELYVNGTLVGTEKRAIRPASVRSNVIAFKA